MKKHITLLAAGLMILGNQLNAQGIKGILKQAEEKVNTVSGQNSPLSEEEVGRGLKEALTIGIEKGVDRVSKPDGFFKDMAIKILMPDEAKKVEEKLRAMGQDKLVDDAIESMNRAAEDAANGAKDIFVTAIKQMTITDAMNILKGEKDAATQYLNRTTRQSLFDKFKPVIKASLDKVGATKHWATLFNTYNKIPMVNKVNPDLEEFVTNKAIDGLFIQIAKEEREIRDNPGARVSDLLKRVFG
jgi:nitrogen regulatory protein PII